jgi:hypothetical protein
MIRIAEAIFVGIASSLATSHHQAVTLLEYLSAT